MFVEEMKEGWNIMLHPGKATKKTLSVSEGLKYYYRLAIIPLVISIVIGAIAAAALPGLAGSASTNPLMSSYGLGAIGGVGIIAAAIVGLLIANPIGMLISAALLQLFGKHLFKAYKNDYEHTFTAYAKGGIVPSTMFYWLSSLPVIGIAFAVIFGIWSFIVAIIALANQQGISRWKSLGVIIGTGVIVYIIIFLVALGVVGLFIHP